MIAVAVHPHIFIQMLQAASNRQKEEAGDLFKSA